jgi:leucyl/phenylalanyl-tRNA--protein transferase
MEPITSQQLLAAYTQGIFPMAASRDAEELEWFLPQERGVLPLDAFHIPRSVQKLLRKHPYDIRCDAAFPEVIRGCAEAPGREDTWINDTIIRLYTELWRMGFAHSVECWRGDQLCGGLYGVAIGGVFCGESMFSLESGASKVALCYLVTHLREREFQLLDTQYVNPYLAQFGAVSISRAEYLQRLARALSFRCRF